MLLVRFRVILRWQPISSSLSRTLISRLSRERSFYNFRAQLFPIFVIWPKYATRAIPRDFKTATFFTRPIAHTNILANSFIIFTRDRFQYSLFGLNMLPVRFRAIMRRQTLSRAQLCTLISWPSRDRSFYKIPTRPLPIFVVWPTYAARTISHESETATFFAHPFADANISALPGALLL